MQRFDALEGLRAPLAWLVVLAHTLQRAGVERNTMPDWLSWAYIGIYPVYGFMILSGFVITHLIVQKQEPFGHYIFRRYMRLAPLLIAAILIAYILRQAELYYFWTKENLPEKIVAEVTLLHGLIPEEVFRRGSMQFIPPAWSISLEWQFYIVAPLIVWAMQKQRFWIAIPLVLLGISALSGSAFDYRSFDLAGLDLTFSKPSQLFAGLPYFLLGMGIYFARLGRFEHTWIILPTFLIVLLSTASKIWLVPFVIVLIVYLSAVSNSIVTRIFEFSWLRYLGQISYSTYLLHFFVVVVVMNFVEPITEKGWNRFYVSAAFIVPITLLISVAAYYSIEKPGIWLAAKLTRRKTPVPHAEIQPAP